MSVQISSFAQVVAEVTTIRSCFADLLARLDRLEIMLTSLDTSPAATQIVDEGPLELAESIVKDVIAEPESNLITTVPEEPAAIGPAAATAVPHSDEPGAATTSAPGAEDLGAVAAAICHANAVLEEPRHHAALMSEAGASYLLVPLPAVVAAHLADKTASIGVVPPTDPGADPQRLDATAQPPASEPVLTFAPTSESLIVLPSVGAATRSASRLGPGMIATVIAASLVVFGGGGLLQGIVDWHWPEALRIAVGGVVKLLPAPY